MNTQYWYEWPKDAGWSVSERFTWCPRKWNRRTHTQIHNWSLWLELWVYSRVCKNQDKNRLCWDSLSLLVEHFLFFLTEIIALACHLIAVDNFGINVKVLTPVWELSLRINVPIDFPFILQDDRGVQQYLLLLFIDSYGARTANLCVTFVCVCLRGLSLVHGCMLEI